MINIKGLSVLGYFIVRPMFIGYVRERSANGDLASPRKAQAVPVHFT